MHGEQLMFSLTMQVTEASVLYNIIYWCCLYNSLLMNCNNFRNYQGWPVNENEDTSVAGGD